MSSSDLIQRGGIAAMLSGAAFIVLMLIPEGPLGSFSERIGTVVFIVALVLLLVGLVGFHTLQKDSYGRIGRAGFYTVIVGASAQIVAAVVRLFGSTALEFLDMVGLLGVFVGLVLYGAASLQARVLPRGSPSCRAGRCARPDTLKKIADVLGVRASELVKS